MQRDGSAETAAHPHHTEANPEIVSRAVTHGYGQLEVDDAEKRNLAVARHQQRPAYGHDIECGNDQKAVR